MEETREWLEENGAENSESTAKEDMPKEIQEAPESSAQPPIEAVWNRLSEELMDLHRSGWTIEQLQAFAQDEDVRAAIASGEATPKVAMTYLTCSEGKDGKEVMPQTTQGDMQERRERKRSVPALRTATTGSVPHDSAIARLSSSEFAKFSDSVYERLMAGEKIAL